MVYPDRELAINPGRVFGKPQGIETRDPAFGMEAVWIEPARREQAQTLGYTVVDASTVIATHLSHIIQTHAHELLGYEEVQQLLNGLAKTAPRLVEDLVPKALPLGIVVRVLQGLLAERVPIRNLRTIIETLAEHARAPRIRPCCRRRCASPSGGRSCRTSSAAAAKLPVVTLEPELEQLLQSSLAGAADGGRSSPGWPSGCRRGSPNRRSARKRSGEPAVLMVAPALRATLARFTRASVPGLHVLAWNEIPDNRRIRLAAAVGRVNRNMT